MILIPDSNVLISALIKKGKTFELFEWNDLTGMLNFIAPEHLSSEIMNNSSNIEKRSKLSKLEFKEILDKIELQIEFVPLSKFRSFIQQALKVSPPNDFPYIALALFLKSQGQKARVLSNDKDLLRALSKLKIGYLPIHELLRELKLI